MLIEYIERMRKEPPAVRRRAVRTWTTVVVLSIAALYIGYRVVRGTVMPTSPSNSSGTIAAPYEVGL